MNNTVTTLFWKGLKRIYFLTRRVVFIYPRRIIIHGNRIKRQVAQVKKAWGDITQPPIRRSRKDSQRKKVFSHLKKLYFATRKLVIIYPQRPFKKRRNTWNMLKKGYTQGRRTGIQILVKGQSGLRRLYFLTRRVVFIYPRRGLIYARRLLLLKKTWRELTQPVIRRTTENSEKKLPVVLAPKNTSFTTSIVVVTRNRSRLLKRCLASLTEQTVPPHEVIVVDNGSTGSTKRVIASFRKRLPLQYVYEKRIGIPFARNTGLSKATGDLILMLDDDCKASRFWVERMAYAHKRNPGAWAIQGRTFSVPETRIYSILAEFNRFLSIRGNAQGATVQIEDMLDRNFQKEFALTTADTRNFSIKRVYVIAEKLRFDERFYRGSDSDFGKQIVHRGGVIMFSPKINVSHWERENLQNFLEQRWHIGRTAARITHKWAKGSKATSKLPKKLFLFIAFCQLNKRGQDLPKLIPLFLFDRLYHINGWFYEKKLLHVR